MSKQYHYFVQNLKPNGQAIVEYTHPDFGSVTVHMVLPIDKPQPHIHQKIIERFPFDEFYAIRLSRQTLLDNIPVIQGNFTMDLDDYFYDVQHETTRTEV